MQQRKLCFQLCLLTNAGASIELVGSIVMETTSAFTVVPARQVDTARVVVTLNQALCTLINICRYEHTATSEPVKTVFLEKKHEPGNPAHLKYI